MTVVLRNTELVSYGIQNERSDLRAHVCVNAKTVYVYPTKKGIEAIETGEFRTAPAWQPGVTFETAIGYLVPPSKIWGCLPINAKWAMDKAGEIRKTDSTTKRGDWAVNVVRHLLSRGYFPLWGTSEIVEATDIQISGVDLIVTSKARIQVKCDYEGGEPVKRGLPGERVTGNLFLQIAECNPLGMK